MTFRKISAIILACIAHEQRSLDTGRYEIALAFLISLEHEYQFWDYGYNGSGN